MRRAAVLVALFMFCVGRAVGSADAQDKVDTALIVAIDVSGSVDETRYHLQMDGLAEALLDDSVTAAVVDSGGIMFLMVAWADQPKVVVDWRRIVSKGDLANLAEVIRKLPIQSGNFTCLGRMLRTLGDVTLPELPIAVGHVVIDVSGDGIDNCMDTDLLREVRREVLSTGATINGLPIIEKGVNDTVNVGAFRAPGFGFPHMSNDPGNDQTTLDRWYKENVVGGPGAFVLAAKGYGDFKRALRQKFVLEISDARRRPAQLR